MLPKLDKENEECAMTNNTEKVRAVEESCQEWWMIKDDAFHYVVTCKMNI